MASNTFTRSNWFIAISSRRMCWFGLSKAIVLLLECRSCNLSFRISACASRSRKVLNPPLHQQRITPPQEQQAGELPNYSSTLAHLLRLLTPHLQRPNRPATLATESSLTTHLVGARQKQSTS